MSVTMYRNSVGKRANPCAMHLPRKANPKFDTRALTANELPQLRKRGVTAGVVLEFLKKQLASTDKQVFLVLDGHPTHKSKAARTFVEALKERLYCNCCRATLPIQIPTNGCGGTSKFTGLEGKSSRCQT